MHKAFRVARTEYLNAVRSKAFLMGLVMLPVFMVGGIVIPQLLKDKVDIKDRRLAIWDRTGRLETILAREATQHNEREIFDWKEGKKGPQIRPAFVIESWQPKASEAAQADILLSERVRHRELFAFLVIGKDAIAADGGKDPEISYYTETPTYTDLPGWIERVVNEEIKRMRLETASLDRNLVAKLTRYTPIQKLGLAKVAATGEVIKAKHENQMATFGIPFISMFLLFMLVMSSAPNLLNTVLEEKLQKIAEVLVSSVSPFELMMGKLLGAVMVSLTLTVLYLGAIVFTIWKYGLADLVPGSHYVWFLLFQLLALLIFGSLFSALGAACSEMRDVQTMMFPAMLFMIIPMFVWMPILQSPMSTFARVLSLVPPLTPMLMMLRISVPPGPPWWEVVLGVVMTTGFMVVCIWASAKIFRIGILSQGQTPTMGRLVTWLWSR
jgi:ABC-2 type transport system permease protein